MKLREFPLLADENIHSDVVDHFRRCGFDVATVAELGLSSADDLAIIQLAHQQQRLIVTHDPDFGALAIVQNQPIVGIVFLRPGHIRAEFTIGTVDAILRTDPDVTPPFILVARRSDTGVTIRLRWL